MPKADPSVRPARGIVRGDRSRRWSAPMQALFPLVIVGLACGPFIFGDAPRAQVAATDFDSADYPVEAALVYGNTLFIAGSFGYVGTPTGGGAILSAATGELVSGSPRVEGVVRAVVPDGSGGWYVGGIFERVGGTSISNLVHLLANHSVDTFDPSPASGVLALALHGSTLYLAGPFGLKAVNVTSGAVAWSLGAAGGDVRALAVSDDGNTVYAGGQFTSLAGQPRNYLGAVDATSGAVTAWNPAPDHPVFAVQAQDTVIYAGGQFNAIGGLSRSGAAALGAVSGLATGWSANTNDIVHALVVSGSTVYLGGQFTYVDGQPRGGLAAVTTAGSLTSFMPLGGGRTVSAIAVHDGLVYAGGNGRTLVAADSATGALTGWNPGPDNTVQAVAAGASEVFAGGNFGLMEAVPRRGIAAIDIATGKVTSWDAKSNAPVHSIVRVGDTLYVGGQFSTGLISTPSIGGAPRNFLAALDVNTGLATSWNPSVNAPVTGLVRNGTSFYLSGNFTSVGGQPRAGLAAVDPSGAATAFAPASDGAAKVLAADANGVYVGGAFQQIGGATRNHLARLAGDTGLATSWDPNPTGDVDAVLPLGPTVYVGGSFSMIGGQPRSNIAAVEASAALALPWNPGADGAVSALAFDGSWLYAGGSFTSIGGQPRNEVAALDTTSVQSDVVPEWHPDILGGSVDALAFGSQQVFAGGTFTYVGGLYQKNLASIGDVSTPTQLALVTADAAADHVRLIWYTPDHDVIEATVYRHDAASDWRPLGDVHPDGSGRLEYVDTDVSPGDRYGYRLGVQESGDEVLYGETWVDVPRASGFALFGSRPNPAGADLRVAFELPDASPAWLELLDLNGRRLESREVGSLGPGRHTLDLAGGRPVPSGVYFVRLTRGVDTRSARIAVIR